MRQGGRKGRREEIIMISIRHSDDDSYGDNGDHTVEYDDDDDD